jgi:hypothetical protein
MAFAAAKKDFAGVSWLTIDVGALRDTAACKRLGIGPRPPEQQRRRIMFAKTLIAALILATTSVALTAKVYAGPKGFDQHEQSYFDRASRVTDGGGL